MDETIEAARREPRKGFEVNVVLRQRPAYHGNIAKPVGVRHPPVDPPSQSSILYETDCRVRLYKRIRRRPTDNGLPNAYVFIS